MSWWSYRFTLTHNTELSSYQLSVHTRNYQHVKTYHIWSNLSVKYLEKIVDCYPQSDSSDGLEQPASLFLVLYSILCPQWSALAGELVWSWCWGTGLVHCKFCTSPPGQTPSTGLRHHSLEEGHSSGAVWESRWTSWAVRPNEPSGFRGRKDLLNRASALVTTCP